MEASSRARAGMARNAASVGFPIALANCAPIFSASGSVIMRAKRRHKLGDPAPDQTLGQRRSGQRVDGAASRRLPEHGDLVRIAAELGDVLLHPLERRKLVQRPIVAGGAMFGFGGQLRMRKPAKDAQR